MAKILKGKQAIATGDSVQEAMWDLKRNPDYEGALIYPKTDDTGAVTDEVHVRLVDKDGEYGKVLILTVDNDE